MSEDELIWLTQEELDYFFSIGPNPSHTIDDKKQWRDLAMNKREDDWTILKQEEIDSLLGMGFEDLVQDPVPSSVEKPRRRTTSIVRAAKAGKLHLRPVSIALQIQTIIKNAEPNERR